MDLTRRIASQDRLSVKRDYDTRGEDSNSSRLLATRFGLVHDRK